MILENNEMNKLDKNFSLEKYGLKVRLVNEDDAAFIVSLRSDPDKTKYMITLDNNIESQKEWIKEYKKREREGLDYYFIYSNNMDIPIGVNRISHIDFKERIAKTSSWIAIKGLINETFKMSVIQSEIAFNILGLETTWCDIHKENKKVVKIFEKFNYKFKDTGTKFYHLYVTKNQFLKSYDHHLSKLFLQSL